jgi:hypothetical protein
MSSDGLDPNPVIILNFEKFPGAGPQNRHQPRSESRCG